MAEKHYIILHSTINTLTADTLGQFTIKKTKTNAVTSPRSSLGTRKCPGLGSEVLGKSHNLWGTQIFHLQREQVELMNTEIS